MDNITYLLIGLFLAMYATKLWFYMDAYQDDFYLGEYAAINSPDAWFAWHIKAMKRFDCGSVKEAMILWSMARNISPLEFKILMNLATCHILAKDKKTAFEFLELAEQNIPKGQEDQAFKILSEFRQGKWMTLL